MVRGMLTRQEVNPLPPHLPPAGMAPEAVTYVAVHGTGTPLGDPIEMGALGQALSGRSSAPASASALRKLTVGSVKSCYGHTEGAAGLTGALLALQAMRSQVGALCSPCFAWFAWRQVHLRGCSRLTTRCCLLPAGLCPHPPPAHHQPLRGIHLCRLAQSPPLGRQCQPPRRSPAAARAG